MDKIIGKTIAEMVVPEDELWHIYGSLPHAYDVWHHTCAEFSDNPDIFAGLRTGKRSDAVQASVFDMIHAEILGEHNAEKAKVRNRRKADRKHVAENWGQEKLNRKDRHFDYMCRDSRRKYGHGKTCYWSSNAERKIVHAERNIRADFDAEIRQHEDALAYHSDYLDMAIDHGERLEYLRKQIRKLDYERMIIANYDREIKYEQNRVNELMRIADTIMEGERY